MFMIKTSAEHASSSLFIVIVYLCIPNLRVLILGVNNRPSQILYTLYGSKPQHFYFSIHQNKNAEFKCLKDSLSELSPLCLSAVRLLHGTFSREAKNI